MTQKEFKQVCESIIPDGFFRNDKAMGTLDFMYKFKVDGIDEKRSFYVVYLHEKVASIVAYLPWKVEPHRSNTCDKEQFAEYLKAVVPPKEDK